MRAADSVCCSPDHSGYFVLEDRERNLVLRDLVDIPCYINRKVGPVICTIAGAIFAGSYFFYGFPVFTQPQKHPVRFSIIITTLAMIVLCTVSFVAYGIWNHLKNRSPSDVTQMDDNL